MSKDTVCIGIDTFDCIVIGKRRQNDVRFGCEFSDAVGDRCAVFNQRLGILTTAVIGHKLVAMFEQASSHTASHVADANKAKARIFFIERVHSTLLPFDFSPGFGGYHCLQLDAFASSVFCLDVALRTRPFSDENRLASMRSVKSKGNPAID